MFFNIIFFIYALFYFPYLLLTGRWYKDYGCRLGIFPYLLSLRIGQESKVWIHAVSVGEVMAISSLIGEIKSRWPKHTIVLTVTTKTGYELARKKLCQQLIIIPSPLDFTWVVSYFVRTIKPKIYISAETEIWPNLYNCLHQHAVPIVMINGRISDKSFGRYMAVKFLFETVLRKVSYFSMQSQLDVTRIIELGAPKDRVSSLGNIKFDDVSVTLDENIDLPYSKGLLLWIAGSTHPGEEEILLNTFQNYRSVCALIIAPRHVERSEELMILVKSKGFKAVRYSQLMTETLNSDTVIIIDTIGHLKALYAKASFVFVGKSLCVGGGQNIIDPAFYGKPIIVGPMMENFRDITSLFKAQGAIIQIEDVEEYKQQFVDQVGRLVRDENLRIQMGQQAMAVVKANQGALLRTITLLEKWL
jgi:3-deoxy-D-manno-octulosonic-acid transferase